MSIETPTSLTVTIQDKEVPKATDCFSPAAEYSTDPDTCSHSLTYTLPTLSDNCDQASTLSAICQDQTPTALSNPHLFQLGDTTVDCYAAPDAAGNVGS
jgi:hypothetical protein